MLNPTGKADEAGEIYRDLVQTVDGRMFMAARYHGGRQQHCIVQVVDSGRQLTVGCIPLVFYWIYVYRTYHNLTVQQNLIVWPAKGQINIIPQCHYIT